MAVVSMTGYARSEVAVGDQRWTWELRSVNGRSLEIRCRLPAGLEGLDPAVRKAVPDFCRRGNVSVSLSSTRNGAAGRLRLNRPLLEELVAAAAELKERYGMKTARLDGLLAVRGVIESGEESTAPLDGAALEPALLRGLGEALEGLRGMRRAEGAQLAAQVDTHLGEVERLRSLAGETAAAQPALLRERLRAQLAELLEAVPMLPEERLAQECAVLVAKGDVREELDRLAAHVEAARALLAEDAAIGRKLDFLCQEFNRETNTLCSKSTDIALTRLGLALKSTVEQLREQVQNIE